MNRHLKSDAFYGASITAQQFVETVSVLQRTTKTHFSAFEIVVHCFYEQNFGDRLKHYSTFSCY